MLFLLATTEDTVNQGRYVETVFPTFVLCPRSDEEEFALQVLKEMGQTLSRVSTTTLELPDRNCFGIFLNQQPLRKPGKYTHGKSVRIARVCWADADTRTLTIPVWAVAARGYVALNAFPESGDVNGRFRDGIRSGVRLCTQLLRRDFESERLKRLRELSRL